jgi:hypothetical protein
LRPHCGALFANEGTIMNKNTRPTRGFWNWLLGSGWTDGGGRG